MTAKRLIIALIILFALGDIFLFVRHRLRPAAVRDVNHKLDLTAPAAAQTSISINGMEVDSSVAQKRPIAVIVENYPDARPQAGLIDADIVYEAPTEGGITRFMALYQSIAATTIGPVRSARTYFAEIADQWGAVFAHVGGNSDALANIKAGDYKNIADADQFFNDPYFHRIKSRPMPHNVYTSVAKLESLINAHGFSNNANFHPWQFKDDAPGSGATDLNVDFSLKDYAVEWKYDSSNNSYLRVLAGKPHKDADSGKQIAAKNIIVQFVATHPTKTDTLYSIDMDLATGGKAEIFLDGKVIIATWKKVDGHLAYFDDQSKEVPFNRGQTWVELVPDGQGVTWK